MKKRLSKEERAAILRLSHKGYSTGEIAQLLNVTERDVIFTIYGNTK